MESSQANACVPDPARELRRKVLGFMPQTRRSPNGYTRRSMLSQLHRIWTMSPAARIRIGLAIGLAAGCTAPSALPPQAADGALPTPVYESDASQLPASHVPDWGAESRTLFEARVLSLLAGPAFTFDDANIETLRDALAGESQTGSPEFALRASLLLAASRSDAADRALLDALELRAPIPARHADAALVAAAGRLSASGLAGLPARLLGLSIGPNAHPDIEIRTECARAALAHGAADAIEPLLAITRLGTPLGIQRDGNWNTAEFTTWSRNRAAEALAKYAGIPCPYRADASIRARERACLRLEAALR